jgi:hypothetical protein
MKKFDLEAELKRARVPERDQEFWDAFPRRVMEQARTGAPDPVIRAQPMNPLAWGFGMALACLSACLCLLETRLPGTLCYTLFHNEREMRQMVRQFPGEVRAFMQDEHGLGKLIEDQP